MSPPPTRKQARSTASRDDILEHAIRLFGLYGYEAVSLRSISDASGVSLGSIYYHFPEKGGLYSEAITRVMDVQSNRVRQRLKLGRSQEESLGNFFAAMRSIVRGDSPANLLVRRAHLDGTPDAQRALAAYAERAVAWHRTELIPFICRLAPDCPNPARLLVRLYYLAWGSAIMEPLTSPALDAAANELIKSDLVDAGLTLVRGMSQTADADLDLRPEIDQARSAAEALAAQLAGLAARLPSPANGDVRPPAARRARGG